MLQLVRGWDMGADGGWDAVPHRMGTAIIDMRGGPVTDDGTPPVWDSYLG
ncbi:hypothetical protein GHA01_27740 [Novacetimonas hansenii]|uniref:Uncharacterized protein n=2 Tax=Novacetimonas hansenii TaxID=436 RepID=A0ABQ0SJ78_NOVHA|nr:hypothetical protein GXY_14957 [Novacetimonas hansenii ATCC 23769]GAN82571.1 hypothetical protein Gaha_0023_013 [Novacetimonas hansenii JCM 7643]GBQ60516.1 hypothetical protein AA0243_2362 [Novacetimonas hansenii NRIC 0243]GEC64925.1 hypothetical protein GHA01_27740 [Novacetimonas hansenii]